MIHRKAAWLLLSTLLFCANALASEQDNVKATFTAYWSAYTTGNYLGAAQQLHPEDLAGIQAEVLPIFTKGLTTSDPRIKLIVADFFKGVPEAKRKTLSGAETFAQLLNLFAILNPAAVAAVKQSRLEVGAVNFDPKSPDSAIINYNLISAEGSTAASEQLSKANGAWFIRTKAKPAAIAASVKADLKL